MKCLTSYISHIEIPMKTKRHFMIGRLPTNNIIIRCPVISRKHCIISIRGNRCFLKNLSSNGTFIYRKQQYILIPQNKWKEVALGDIVFCSNVKVFKCEHKDFCLEPLQLNFNFV